MQYILLFSFGIFLEWIKNIVFIPFFMKVLTPCASLSKSLASAVVQIFLFESLTNYLYSSSSPVSLSRTAFITLLIRWVSGSIRCGLLLYFSDFLLTWLKILYFFVLILHKRLILSCASSCSISYRVGGGSIWSPNWVTLTGSLHNRITQLLPVTVVLAFESNSYFPYLIVGENDFFVLVLEILIPVNQNWLILLKFVVALNRLLYKDMI